MSIPPARVGPQKRSLEDLMNGGAVSGAQSSSMFGSSNGITSIGFGSSSSSNKDTNNIGFGADSIDKHQMPVQHIANSPWAAAAAVSKKPKTELTEKSTNTVISNATLASAKPAAATTTLPAFLQPANVTATYGAQAASDKNT